MDDIDFKKLSIQEPDFAAFTKNAIFESYLITKSGRELLKAMYNFYQIGMTEKQVTQFMANAMRQNGADNG